MDSISSSFKKAPRSDMFGETFFSGYGPAVRKAMTHLSFSTSG
jgi:hypothetical protein